MGKCYLKKKRKKPHKVHMYDSTRMKCLIKKEIFTDSSSSVVNLKNKQTEPSLYIKSYSKQRMPKVGETVFLGEVPPDWLSNDRWLDLKSHTYK